MNNGLRAVMVCVDYLDLLSITLPYNQHHFSDVTIITDGKCFEAVKKFCWDMGSPSYTSVTILSTELFYERGAKFNKWAALEFGLDQIGRDGWLCLMDADVLFPKRLYIDSWSEPDGSPSSLGIGLNGKEMHIYPGQLCTPHRRMFSTLPREPVPESEWSKYPVHRNVNEWAGYCQIFHGSDAVLGPPPWHQTNWTHAGGADSFFQLKWDKKNKVRPPFEVLHLGEAGVNWMGRTSAYTDGSVPEGAEERRELLARTILKRRTAPPPKRFDHEKLDT